MVVQAQIRVLYGDTDAMGHAYYGNYLRWFEAGRAEWFRTCGMSYRDIEKSGVWLPVVEAHCRYRMPAYYDDLLAVHTSFGFSGKARLRFDYEIMRGGDALADGFTVHVCLGADRKVMRPPEHLKELLEAIRTAPDSRTS